MQYVAKLKHVITCCVCNALCSKIETRNNMLCVCTALCSEIKTRNNVLCV